MPSLSAGEGGTVFAQAGLEIPCYGTTHADTFYGSVPVTRKLSPTEVSGDYERATGRVIVECFRDKGLKASEMVGVLIHSHAPFTWGKDAAQAVEHAIVLENTAEMAILSRSLNNNVSPIDSYLLDKHFLRKHGKKAYYGQVAAH